MKRLEFKHIKMTLIVILFIGLGVGLGRVSEDTWLSLKYWFLPAPQLYFTSNKTLLTSYQSTNTLALDWVSLLPKSELDVIARYQVSKPDKTADLSEQILLSIEAATDPDYKAALQSSNTVSAYESKMVAISGFIVPLDFYADKTVKNMFLVPYFGACLHFPAPPPNQIIFATLEAGFSELKLNQAFTLTGQFGQGLFEDPMGTSAYTLDVVSIVPFHGQPDDLRKH